MVSPADAGEDVLINGKNITVLVGPNIDDTAVGLSFQLTPGASILPESGTIRDFSTPQTYTVTSEDGKWKKTYTVLVTSVVSIPHSFSFEDARLVNDKYYAFYETLNNDTQQMIWDSGNSGYQLLAGNKTPDDYPTASYSEGKEGKCLKLETVSTGALGALFMKPIAAGNLYLGHFDSSNAFNKPLEATKFGAPLDFFPTEMTGYYKYKAGDQLTDKTGAVVDGTDTFDIYAVVFEPDSKNPYLDGSNSLTSDRLVAVARIKAEDRKETGEWTKFSLPFVLQPGKIIDKTKLFNNQYSITIVLSSSIDGAEFRGAVGSTLFIDEIKLVTE